MGEWQGLMQGTSMDLLAEVAGGAVGGNLAAAALKYFSLGTVWNSLAGMLGGAAGARALFGLGIMAAESGKAGALGMEALAGGLGGMGFIILLGLIRSLAAR